MKQTKEEIGTRIATVNMSFPVQIRGDVTKEDFRAFVEEFLYRRVTLSFEEGSYRRIGFNGSIDLYKALLGDTKNCFAVSSFDKKVKI